MSARAKVEMSDGGHARSIEVVGDLAGVPDHLKGGAIAIGNFDGVHRGHQAVLERTRTIAKEIGGPAGVMLFSPHPRQFFRPADPHFTLTPLPERLRLLEALGLDLAVVLPFDERMAGLDAESFVTGILVEKLAVRHVVIGYDFHFGRGRTGSPDVMRALGARFGFGVTVSDPVGEAGEVFSSSRVRALIAAGDVRGAAEVLGHWWRVVGRVVGGAHRGTGMGFPTANLRMEPGYVLKHGIYAARVVVDGVRHGAAAYLGTRPTFDNGAPVLEVFLFDFDGDLYGREIAVEMIAHLRDDRAFPDVEALMRQMEKDCDAARSILAAVAAEDPMQRFPLGRALAATAG
ncbi:MAG: bifunctional riboflavin kinase/FAD synthetase [Hyphomicrobiaceae bacterium]